MLLRVLGIVGVVLSVASFILSVQVEMWLSKDVEMWLFSLSPSVSICLYLVQSVFENFSRGQIGIWIGLVDIVITIGIWSDGVIGLGLRWVLAVTLVSKKGPICLHLSVSINVTICCPRKLLFL